VLRWSGAARVVASTDANTSDLYRSHTGLVRVALVSCPHHLRLLRTERDQSQLQERTRTHSS
jgi:hypothetical protein